MRWAKLTVLGVSLIIVMGCAQSPTPCNDVAQNLQDLAWQEYRLMTHHAGKSHEQSVQTSQISTYFYQTVIDDWRMANEPLRKEYIKFLKEHCNGNA